MNEELFYNETIRCLLASIAKLDEKIGPIELIAGWYDDLYYPCQKDKDIYNEAVWEQGQKEWKDCFSKTELNALEKFHMHFEQVIDQLSDDNRNFKNDLNWKNLQKAAKVALSEMDEAKNT